MPILPNGTFKDRVSIIAHIKVNRRIADGIERLAAERGMNETPQSANKLRAEADELEACLQ